MFLGKAKLDTIGVLIFRNNPYNSHEKFFSVNNVLREYNKMKQEIKITETSVEYNMIDISRKTYVRNSI